ncbi:ubiquitin-like-specific protease 2 isoform X3 [Selaginella moellendorffii]|uniref:ubiquitin-like-specific protease 2 isoform X3 n=1 Tax=Selaginella moellendorffii TaxID=88036 RepID=UPI000D1D0BD8|nr:ubiquitin-like-specific protease 2 isoform X3 [Selaginella moellendorffii]|eukprot:XP_024518930.1 ubiquitin-like-specific protease 2 isoform X3 [Selaginella moellendorffii]
MAPKRQSARLMQQRLPEEEQMRIALANSMKTFKEEQRQCADLSHLDDVKLDATQRTTQVFRRRKRPRQEEDEEPAVSNGGNDENSGKSRTMDEIVESTEILKDAPAKARSAGKSKQSKTTKRQKSLKRLIPSTKKKKKKDLVRSYFGFSAPGKLEEPSPEGSNEFQEVLLVDDEDHLQDSEQQLKRCGVKFAYPSRNDPEAVEVEEHHLQCLAEHEYVNDTIIDLYIKYILVSQSTELERFHVFNSFFFKRLAQAVCDEDYVESVGKLRKWTKGVDIYDKAYVLMPVHQQMHWSLVVVCFSGPKPGCHILHLDSMQTGHVSRPIYEVVRRYLAAEWISHGGENKDFKNVHERKVKVPKQQNEYDCGLFMLHYIQQFLSKAPASFSDSMVKDMHAWFSLAEASKLRTTIRDITDKIFFPKEGKEEPALDSVAIDGATKPESEQDPSAAFINEATVEGSNGDNTTQQAVTNDTTQQAVANDNTNQQAVTNDPASVPSSEERRDDDPANVPSNEEIRDDHPAGNPSSEEILPASTGNDPVNNSSTEEIVPASTGNDPANNPSTEEIIPGRSDPDGMVPGESHEDHPASS